MAKRADTVIGGTPITNAPKGVRSVSGIKSGVEDGQRKAVTQSGFPGMMDTRPQEKDINKSADK